MSLRSLKNDFKQPIYKDDLKRALISGFLNMLLFAIFAGAIQYFTGYYIGLEFGIFIWLISYMIGKRINDNTSTHHIWYSIIAVIFFLIGYLIYKYTYWLFYLRDFGLTFRVLFSFEGLAYYLFPFFNFKTYTGISIFNNIVDIIILIFGIFLAWRLPYSKKQ